MPYFPTLYNLELENVSQILFPIVFNFARHVIYSIHGITKFGETLSHL